MKSLAYFCGCAIAIASVVPVLASWISSKVGLAGFLHKNHNRSMQKNVFGI